MTLVHPPSMINTVQAVRSAPELSAGRADRPELRRWWKQWWPLCIGLAVLFVSTSWRFALNLWQLPEFEHGPMLLAGALWLLWDKRTAIVRAQPPAVVAGPATLLAAGVLAYLLGVRLKAGYLEFGALAPVTAGALALVGGWSLARKCAFALLILVMASPMPAPLIYAGTAGLKIWVSNSAEFLLHLAGYPVARDGVTLRMGQYNLLLADACSGMNSLISLSALGMLYIYLTGRRALWHTSILVAAILPVAVATNVVRVLILMLVTYYLGDEAGRGFLHEFAGFVMFLAALLIFTLFDGLLGRTARVLGRRFAK